MAIGQQLGVSEFKNSGSSAAQEAFLRGVLQLHSFEYDDAASAFLEAQKADPKFALAYWGEAMTSYRPVWGYERLKEGRAALKKGASAKAGTDREQAYLDAVGILFGKGEREERWMRYTAAMESMAERYPDDLEAASLHAVSLFGTTPRQRDHPTYMRIAAIAADVFRKNPKHPGAVHYLIHAFDDPIHAPLGLPYAQVYADIAPAAPHAQHMPSHIFLALGMWDDVVSSNTDSWNSSEARVKRLGLGTDDRGYHALWWMQYAYLQQGNLEAARKNLAVIEADASRSKTKLARDHYAYLRSHILVDGERWKDDLRLVDDEGLTARAWGANALAEGMRALKNDDVAGARQWSEKLNKRASSEKDSHSSIPVAALELEALVLMQDGKSEDALAKLREAVEMEKSTPFGYGPPFPVKPAHELLADALLELGRAEESVTAYRAALDRTPERALAVKGLKAAMKAAH